jgi:hypothetical protein
LLWYPQNDQCKFAYLYLAEMWVPVQGKNSKLCTPFEWPVEIIYKQRVPSCEMSKQSFTNKTTGRMVLNQSTLRVMTFNHTVRN